MQPLTASKALLIAAGVVGLVFAYSRLRVFVADTVRDETIAEIDRQVARGAGMTSAPLLVALGVPQVKILVAEVARNTVLKTLPPLPWERTQ